MIVYVFRSRATGELVYCEHRNITDPSCYDYLGTQEQQNIQPEKRVTVKDIPITEENVNDILDYKMINELTMRGAKKVHLFYEVEE